MHINASRQNMIPQALCGQVVDAFVLRCAGITALPSALRDHFLGCSFHWLLKPSQQTLPMILFHVKQHQSHYLLYVSAI